MVIAKQDVLEMVDSLPAAVDLEELQYRLYLRQKLEAAEAQVESGDVISDEAIGEEIAKWSSE